MNPLPPESQSGALPGELRPPWTGLTRKTAFSWPKSGRGREIRTPDILLPKQARYQTALYPDKPECQNNNPCSGGGIILMRPGEINFVTGILLRLRGKTQLSASSSRTAAPERTVGSILKRYAGARELLANCIRASVILVQLGAATPFDKFLYLGCAEFPRSPRVL